MPRPAPRGAMVDIGGRRLHVVHKGLATGAPLVVLEAGSYGASADWAAIQPLLAARGVRSLAYDRAGMGLSDPGPEPRDGLAVAADLESLLAALGEAGPLVLVGHSMAGLHVSLFAGRNRARVRGLVLLDAFTPEMARHPRIVAGARQYGRFARGLAAAARLGVLKPFARFGDRIGVEGVARAHKHWNAADEGHHRTAAGEVSAWAACVAQGLAVGPPDPSWPIAVVTAGAVPRPAGFRALQETAAASSRHPHVDRVARARHANLLGASHAPRVVAAIEHVLKTRPA